MRKRQDRTTEHEISIAVLRIAAERPDGVATLHMIKRLIPDLLDLTAADRVQSTTRPNEEMWEQQIRNIKSHFDVPGNIIHEGYAKHIPRVGYEITDSGRRYLKREGY